MNMNHNKIIPFLTITLQQPVHREGLAVVAMILELLLGLGLLLDDQVVVGVHLEPDLDLGDGVGDVGHLDGLVPCGEILEPHGVAVVAGIDVGRGHIIAVRDEQVHLLGVEPLGLQGHGRLGLHEVDGALVVEHLVAGWVHLVHFEPALGILNTAVDSLGISGYWGRLGADLGNELLLLVLDGVQHQLDLGELLLGDPSMDHELSGSVEDLGVVAV